MARVGPLSRKELVANLRRRGRLSAAGRRREPDRAVPVRARALPAQIA